MGESLDVLIVGAGIAGVSVGERLAAAGVGRVLIVEKETMPATGATSRSAGGIRQQFGDAAKIRAARFGSRVFEDFEARYGVDPGFKKHGYLILHTGEDGARRLEEAVDLQRRAGLDTRLLDPSEVQTRFPGLNTEDVRAASFNGTDGYLDPHAVVQGFSRAFRDRGGRIECDTPVERLLLNEGKVTGVKTPGKEIHAGRVVLACGPQTNRLLERSGLGLPIRTCRRQIFSTGPVPGVAPHWPLILDMDAPFYFRPEPGGLIMSLAEVDEMAPPKSGNEIPLSRKDLPELALRASFRCPCLAEAEIRSGWAGLRCITPDERPILGPLPDYDGLYIAAGFSGHGITMAPFTGEFLMREITGNPLEETERAPFLAARFF